MELNRGNNKCDFSIIIYCLPFRDGCSCDVVVNENGTGLVVKSGIFENNDLFDSGGPSNAGWKKKNGSNGGGGICIGKGGKK